ncbi:hypothetical protein J437_LFUL007395 [Ladona fulva]|uniref:Uncharacterized protein n=1 Tax=Ladona fulva TaxID=123851 RepID=A0A8K0NYG1_LADFU|nr:hypothetical protein J437_LFUL007395 [Ladona fulva]
MLEEELRLRRDFRLLQREITDAIADWRKHHNELIILTWNAGGAVARKTPELFSFMLKHRVEVALLQETHLRPHHRWSVPGYAVYRQDRQTPP